MLADEELRSLLNNKILKSEMNEVRARGLTPLLSGEDSWSDDHAAIEAGTLEPSDSPFFLEEFSRHRAAFEAVLRAYVMPKLSLPQCWTLAELVSLAVTHLFVRDQEFDGAWKRFVSAAVGPASVTRNSEPFPVGRITGSRKQIVLWLDSEKDGSVQTAGSIMGVSFAIATLRCSLAAMAQFEDEVRSLLACVLRSVSKTDNPIEIARETLGIYFGNHRKGSMAYRMRSAIQLLVEADAQRHDAIGLALGVAALEALLGVKSESFAESVAQNVAVLLEPRAKHRADASRFVKRLYDARSRILHGDMVRSDTTSRERGRKVTIAVLLALQRVKVTLEDAPDEFFRELRSCYATGTKMLETRDTAVCDLWRDDTK